MKMKMHAGRLFLLGFLMVGLMGAKTCGKDAEMRINSAKIVIDEARDSNAPEYAPEEFRSAEESLLLAQQQFEKRSYRSAESSALQAETQGRIALEKSLAYREQQAELEKQEREKQEEERLAYNVSSLYSDTIIESSSEAEAANAALHDVHFDFDSSALSDHARSILDLNAEWLKQHPNLRVEIEGHCDERGDIEYNLSLGTKRARMVQDYMAAGGIEASRMQTISYGESAPADPGHGEEAWARNRRAHFAVVP
jgi:peptidoglycan-associated lipoprotein